MPLLRVLAGPDGEDPVCEARSLQDPATVDISQLTVLDVPDDGHLGVSDELRAAQERAASALSRRGARVRVVRFPLRHRSIRSALLGAAQETPFEITLGNGRRIASSGELAKWAVRRSDYTLMALVLAIINPIPRRFPRLRTRFVEISRRLGASIRERSAQRVMLYPVYPTTAPRHSMPVWSYLFLRFPSGYQGVFNVLELPSTAVPLGLGRGGLPLGTQVVGPHGGDHLTIATALALEQEFGGWVPPPRRGLKAALEPRILAARAARSGSTVRERSTLCWRSSSRSRRFQQRRLRRQRTLSPRLSPRSAWTEASTRDSCTTNRSQPTCARSSTRRSGAARG